MQPGYTPSYHTAALPSPVLPGLTGSFPQVLHQCFRPGLNSSHTPVHAEKQVFLLCQVCLSEGCAQGESGDASDGMQILPSKPQSPQDERRSQDKTLWPRMGAKGTSHQCDRKATVGSDPRRFGIVLTPFSARICAAPRSYQERFVPPVREEKENRKS